MIKPITDVYAYDSLGNPSNKSDEHPSNYTDTVFRVRVNARILLFFKIHHEPAHALKVVFVSDKPQPC